MFRQVKCYAITKVSLSTYFRNFFAEDGAVFPIYKNYSEDRVKKDIENIHLFIWLDAHKPYRFLFNTINSKHQDRLCSMFGYDPENLELIHS